MNITFKFPQISSVIETIHGHIKNANLLQKCWLARWISISLWHSCFHGDRNWARYSSLNLWYHQVMLLAYCFTYQSLSPFWAIISITNQNISYIVPSLSQLLLGNLIPPIKKRHFVLFTTVKYLKLLKLISQIYNCKKKPKFIE